MFAPAARRRDGPATGCGVGVRYRWCPTAVAPDKSDAASSASSSLGACESAASSAREARYRAAICCAGLLFLARALAGRQRLSIWRDARAWDMDQVLPSVPSSSSSPPSAF